MEHDFLQFGNILLKANKSLEVMHLICNLRLCRRTVYDYIAVPCNSCPKHALHIDACANTALLTYFNWNIISETIYESSHSWAHTWIGDQVKVERRSRDNRATIARQSSDDRATVERWSRDSRATIGRQLSDDRAYRLSDDRATV